MRPLLARIDTEVAAGRLWRAKEIVRGHISNTWPSPVVLERYGQILLSLGDEMDAGRYLWLSGVRTAQYEKAIALFWSRHGRHGKDILLAQLPKTCRRLEFDQLPTEVRRELAALGVSGGDFGATRRNTGLRPMRSPWKDSLVVVIGIGFVVSVFVGAGVGFRAIVMWVTHWFR